MEVKVLGVASFLCILEVHAGYKEQEAAEKIQEVCVLQSCHSTSHNNDNSSSPMTEIWIRV